LGGGGRAHAIASLDLSVIAATLIVNVFVVVYERRRGKELESALLTADAAHTGSDILVTLLAFASLALSRVGCPLLDLARAIAVAGEIPVDEAHRLADAVEAAIEREFGTSQVTVHVEPA